MASALSFPRIRCESREEFDLELASFGTYLAPGGKGGYGSVLLSEKVHNLAIKVFFQQDPESNNYSKIAHHEANILFKLNQKGVSHIPKFIFFLHGPKRCAIGMTRSSPDIYQAHIKTKNLPQFEEMKKLVFRWITSLDQMHAAGFMHTDVKPENLSNLVLDFNLARKAQTYREIPVCARHYRPPEVILNLNFNETIDVFSLSAVLFELYTRIHLFPTEDTNNYQTDLLHLHLVQQRLGKPLPQKLCTDSKFCNQDDESGDWVLKPIETDISHILPFEEQIRLSANAREDTKNDDLEDFIDLLRLMLEPNPDERFTFSDALCHPFLLLEAEEKETSSASD